ncbi:MAG: Fe-S protein maturation auxiliary factor YitW [Nitrospira sp.]|nr:metal-sulfur cluster assembly factor [Nitrospira sp.]ULA61909.1 MAG: Fe-S protein maturation auxiliary factor YitW [Nitrospira sp.]
MATEQQGSSSDPRIMEALRQVVDPELGINIVDLGLVYGSELRDGQVHVTMTMTTPACPMEELLMEMVHSAILRELSEARSVDVNLVWDPPWKPDMMSPAAKAQLGRT